MSPNITVRIQSYHILRRDSRGGVALLIKNNFLFYKMQIKHSQEELAQNQCVAAKVVITKTVHLVVSSIYCPPGIIPSKKLLMFLSDGLENVIIMGYFNAKHQVFPCTHISSSNSSADILDILNT